MEGEPTGEFFVWQRLRAEGASPSQLLAEFEQDRPPVNVEAIAQHLGVPPRMGKGPDVRGILRFTEDEASVWLSPDQPVERRREALGWLLGHLLLHPPGEYQAVGDLGGGAKQSAAMRFARDLLLPKSLVEQELRAGTAKEALRERFLVTAELMDNWLSDAGLAPPSLDRRREERVAARIDIRFSEAKPAARALKAYSLNLSVGGLCLKTSKKYSVGDVLKLHMQVANSEFDLEGAVAWVRGDAIGVRFHKLSEDDKRRLEAMVDSLRG